MDFFQAQDDARRKTWQLALLFVAAVVTIVLLIDILVIIFLYPHDPSAHSVSVQLASVPLKFWLQLSGAGIAVIALGSAFKYLMLRGGGGRAVAEGLGGRAMQWDSSDANGRKLLNVVEEMAIASGVPVPPTYLLDDERGINAFAAGNSADDAVIGITHGTLHHLGRDELQGVVAHEFSHILHGDTRINLRLMALLNGILFIGYIGYFLLRASIGTGHRHRSSRGQGGGAALAMAAAGIGLIAIGAVGVFFGNLIKAAVSRQREYLADAAAVQFTRNPEGIGGALKKIGGLSLGSKIGHPSASEASHMLFGQGIKSAFSNTAMTTHPPLDQRIRAIDPQWDGNFTPLSDALEPVETLSNARPAATEGGGGVPFAAGAVTIGLSPVALAETVGQPSQRSLAHAVSLIDSIPPALREAAHDPWGARGLIYALLLNADQQSRSHQLLRIDQFAQPGVPAQVRQLHPLLLNSNALQRISLIELTIPTLKTLSEPQYRSLVANIIALIQIDGEVSLFEWALHRLLLKSLKPHFEGSYAVRERHRTIAPVAAEAATLLSALANTAQTDATAARSAFEQGLTELGIEADMDTAPDANFVRLNQAFNALRELRPSAKPALVRACAATVLADQRVSADEGALLHGIFATLDCPLPPSIYETIQSQAI